MRGTVCLGLVVGALATACGPGERQAVVAVVADRDGANVLVMRTSVLLPDADKAPWFDAVAASGLSASAAPYDTPPLNVCLIETAAAAPFTAFTLLDPGPATLTGPEGVSANLGPASPTAGAGTGMVGAFPPEDMPFTSNTDYAVQTTGSGEAPSLGAVIRAPPDFDLELIGINNPGPGTLDIPKRADFNVRWSPGAPEAEMYIVLVVENATPTTLVCRVTDSGEFKVKSKIMEKLPLGTGMLYFERILWARFKTQLGPDGAPTRGRIRFAARHTYKIEVK